jgi:hypothetical protein
MILSIARVRDFDQFWATFTTKGAAKRKEYGSSGSRVFRDPDDPNLTYTVLDWDPKSFERFRSDPEMQEIFKEAGLEAPPRLAELAGEHDA